MEEKIILQKLVVRGGRYELSISTMEQPLVVEAEAVHGRGLAEGVVLTASQLQQLQAEAQDLACDDELSRILSLREHSVREAEFKLQRRGFGAEPIKKAVRKYRLLDLLDDARYARSLVETALKRNPSGRAYLVALLRRKGISRALAEQTAAASLRGVDEFDLAVQALKKRWAGYRQLELERARRRAYNYLSRRGISYEAAKTAFEKLYNEK